MLWIFVSLDLDRLSGLDAEHRSDTESRRNGAIDGTSDVYRLLRAAAMEMNAVHRQRFVVVVVRRNRDDADNDTLYVFGPRTPSEGQRGTVTANDCGYVEPDHLMKGNEPILGALALVCDCLCFGVVAFSV